MPDKIFLYTLIRYNEIFEAETATEFNLYITLSH